MFSEYASRFLAQSSRISNAQPDSADATAQHDRFRRSSQPFRGSSRQPAGRPGNPYQSVTSNFNFSSRYAAADAPLFHSALDQFREEDDEEEQERENADLYALQQSRRVFVATRLAESAETDGSHASLGESREDDGGALAERGRGIKSSWNGGIQSTRIRGRTPETVGEEGEEPRSSEESSSARDRMDDVGLESVAGESEPPESYNVAGDQSPSLFQPFRNLPQPGAGRSGIDTKRTQPIDIESLRGLGGRPRAASIETVPATIATNLQEAPKHDVFWGSLYLICMGGLFATFFLVFLHTNPPTGAVGDTIYNTLRSSFHLFAVDTVVAVFVSFLWLALLRSYVKPLVALILLAVPVILFSFSLYPLVASYNGTDHGTGFQDRVMRWLSFIPGVFAAVWVYTIYKGRRSLRKAIDILEFASRILAANPALTMLGFATTFVVVLWTWTWLGMFTRVFLSGDGTTKAVYKFAVDASSWWLAVFFFMIYIWTLSVISGIQRATTAATVSQWYFHRNVQPSPSSREIVAAAFGHATTTIFGTICLASLLALLIRLPLMVFPKRFVGVVSMIAYTLIPAPVMSLLNPLCLTYAAIHSQALHTSARGLGQMTFLTPQAPTTTLTPRSFSSRTHASSPLLSYRLAKLLLHATRFIMAMALGFGGWVATARQLAINMPDGAGIRGSAYAYVVGLVAGFIGWGVLGAMEGVLSGIVDASVVCWGSEKGMTGGGAYCLEAGFLFSDSRDGS